MKEIRVQSQVQEYPTCHGATKAVRHNHWACALEPRSHNYRNPCALEPVLCNKRSYWYEKTVHYNQREAWLPATKEKPMQQWRPSTNKNKRKEERKKLGNEEETKAKGSQFSSVSHVQLFATPWTIACQVSLSIMNSLSLLKLMSIQRYHPTISSSITSPPAFNLSQNQGLFQWITSSYQVAKVLELQLQHQSFQWIFKTDLF